MRKRKLYKEYDYEEIYNKSVLGEETVEDAIQRGKKMVRKVLVKTTQSGEMLESDVYPVLLNIPEGCREKKKRTREQQKDLNDRNARKKFVRYVNTNFTEGDLFITLPYEDYYYPTFRQAKRDIKNYIAKLRRYRKRHDMEQLKYIYIISFLEEGESTKKVRMHHHIIINAMDRDVAEKLWTKSNRANSKKLKPDKYFLTAVATYLAGNNGRRRWEKSRNLKKPKQNRSVSKLSRKKLNELARDKAIHKEVFEKMYKGKYMFLDSEIRWSDYVGSFYIYARMRRII